MLCGGDDENVRVGGRVRREGVRCFERAWWRVVDVVVGFWRWVRRWVDDSSGFGDEGVVMGFVVGESDGDGEEVLGVEFSMDRY